MPLTPQSFLSFPPLIYFCGQLWRNRMENGHESFHASTLTTSTLLCKRKIIMAGSWKRVQWPAARNPSRMTEGIFRSTGSAPLIQSTPFLLLAILSLWC